MPITADKQAIKAAIREALDEVTLQYSQGIGTFVDSILKAVAQMGDAYDAFYTRNLSEDRPELAAAFLEWRLQAAKTAQDLLASKTAQLEKMHEQVQTRVARLSRRPPTSARKRRSRKP